MNYTLFTLLSVICLFCGILLFSEIGRRLGIAKLKRDPEGMEKGAGPAEAAVFGLLGLIMAFTFSGAASRFEGRRHLLLEEANAIGTAYLRIDLLPADSAPEMKDLFRRYTDIRATTFQYIEDQNATKAKLTEAATLQGEIWTKTLAASKRPEAAPQATMLMLPALNSMFDITTARSLATRNHPPLVVFLLLYGLSMVGGLLMGYDTAPSKKRSWLHMMVFAAIMSSAVYVILDIEFPRRGLIRVDNADQILIELRKNMH